MRTPAPPRRWMSWPCGSSGWGKGFVAGQAQGPVRGSVCPPFGPRIIAALRGAHKKPGGHTGPPLRSSFEGCAGRTYMSDPANAKPRPVKGAPGEGFFNNPFPVAIDPPITLNRFPRLSVFLPNNPGDPSRPRGCCSLTARPRGVPCRACARACRRPPASAPGRQAPHPPLR